MRRFMLPLTLSALFVASSATAGTREGVTLPDTQKVGDTSLVLNGIGIREATVFNVNVYMAGLYVEKKTTKGSAVIDPKAPKKILMHFVRDVDAGDIRGAYTEGFAKNGGKGLEGKVKKLNGWMGDMKDGQRMALIYEPGKGTTVQVRGKNRGTIAGEKFAKVLFTIFFGPKPPNSDLKEGMLKGK